MPPARTRTAETDETALQPNPDILDRLRCPRCRGPVDRDGDRFVCPHGHAIVVRDGYLDASAGAADRVTARTLASFGYEWTAFGAIQPEDERFWQIYVADVPLEALAGRVGLDAGCGKGRFTYFMARHLGTLVALDGSDAVQSAVANLAPLDNVTVVRSDVRSTPFADASFGFVSCLGVLHHLPDPRAGFDELVRVLAPGGQLLLYVYSRPVRPGLRAGGLAIARAMRTVTARMPHRPLRAFSAAVAAALWPYVLVLRGAGGRLAGEQAPLATYCDKPFRSLWLDTFDRLSAPLEARYRWEELAAWFQETGLVVDHVRDQAGWFVVGHRPDESPADADRADL